MRESAEAKAVRYFAEDRITVTLANEHGIRLDVRGSRAEPYHVRYGSHRGSIIAECDCPHPRATCAHIIAAKKLHRI